MADDQLPVATRPPAPPLLALREHVARAREAARADWPAGERARAIEHAEHRLREQAVAQVLAPPVRAPVCLGQVGANGERELRHLVHLDCQLPEVGELGGAAHNVGQLHLDRALVLGRRAVLQRARRAVRRAMVAAAWRAARKRARGVQRRAARAARAVRRVRLSLGRGAVAGSVVIRVAIARRPSSSSASSASAASSSSSSAAAAAAALSSALTSASVAATATAGAAGSSTTVGVLRSLRERRARAQHLRAALLKTRALWLEGRRRARRARRRRRRCAGTGVLLRRSACAPRRAARRARSARPRRRRRVERQRLRGRLRGRHRHPRRWATAR